MKIALIEDDHDTAQFVAEGLARHDYEVVHFVDGETGLAAVLSQEYDLALIDRRLPLMDGLTLVQHARDAGVQIPIIFLTTMDGVDDRVDGLDAGGDDYLVKPFSFAELRARVSALARRQSMIAPSDEIRIADLTINLVRRVVSREGSDIYLQPREFNLLEYLVRNRGQVATRKMLLEKVWGFHFDPKTNIVESHMSRLRSKLGAAGGTDVIRTIRGEGYIIDVA